MINPAYEFWPIWTDWLEEQEQETAFLKFCLEYNFFVISIDFVKLIANFIECYDKDNNGDNEDNNMIYYTDIGYPAGDGNWFSHENTREDYIGNGDMYYEYSL